MARSKQILLPAGILILAVGLSMIFINQYFFASVGLTPSESIWILGVIASFLGGSLIVASWFR